MRRRDFLGSSLLGGCLTLARGLRAEEKSAGALEIGSRRELFLDETLIESLEGVERRLHHPTPQNVAIACDAPWEGTGSGYFTVFQDGELFRMFYRGSQLGVQGGKLSEPQGRLCYAESDDGILWRKPELGLVEFNGPKQNNIVLDSGAFSGLPVSVDINHFTVILDENPDTPSEARYKALAASWKPTKALYALSSPDGLRWKPLATEPVLTDGAFDSQNLAFWDAGKKEYRAYYRFFAHGRRDIKTATSKDFIHWTPGEPLEYPGATPAQLYTNQVKPYYRAPHFSIGFPTRYIERGWSDSMRALPERELREARAAANLRYGTALTEGLLMSSRDGRVFHRFDEAFLRPGPERKGTWNYGHQYIAWQMVETRSALDAALPEISLYASERYWHGPGSVLRRYTLRPDGFVSLHAPMKQGEFLTKPIIFQGNRLSINFATSASGTVRVGLQAADGAPIPNFTTSDSQDLFGDSLARVVTWKGGSDLSALAGRPIQLRFTLQDADLYAYQFHE